MRKIIFFVTEERRPYFQEVKNYASKFIPIDNYDFHEAYWHVTVGLRPLITPGFLQYSYMITGNPPKKLRDLFDKYNAGESTFGNIGYYYYLEGQEIPETPFAFILKDWSHFTNEKLIYHGTHKRFLSPYSFKLSIYDIGKFYVCLMNEFGFFFPKGYSGDETKFILSEERLDLMLPIADVFYEYGLTGLAELLNYFNMKIAVKILGEKI
jgi:hypothetical protein